MNGKLRQGKMQEIIGVAGIGRLRTYDRYESMFIYKDNIYKFKGYQLEYLIWTKAPTDDEYVTLITQLKPGGYTNVRNQRDLRMLQTSGGKEEE